MNCKECGDHGIWMPMEGPLDMRVFYCGCEVGEKEKMKHNGFMGHSYYADHKCNCPNCEKRDNATGDIK